MKRLILPIIVTMVLTIAACGHTPPQINKVNVTYPLPAASCDNQFSAKENTQLSVPHIWQSAPVIPVDGGRQNWAAGIAMISNYLGMPKAPCQIASYKTPGGVTCCDPGFLSATGFDADCRRAASADKINRTCEAINLHYSYIQRPLSERELRTEISNGRPVLISQYTGYNAHQQIYLLDGFSKNLYHVLDPAANGKAWDITYAGLFKRWNESWLLFSFRQDACNPQFNTNCECGKYN